MAINLPDYITTTGTTTGTINVDNTITWAPMHTKKDYIRDFFYRCESEDRMLLILDKVKEGKLSSQEALDILKGIKHFEINDRLQTDT